MTYSHLKANILLSMVAFRSSCSYKFLADKFVNEYDFNLAFNTLNNDGLIKFWGISDDGVARFTTCDIKQVQEFCDKVEFTSMDYLLYIANN